MVAAALVTLALAACDGSATTGSASTAALPTTPHTGPAAELAPSQVSLATVAEPAAPDRCADADVDIVPGAGSPPDSDYVLTFRNAGTVECEVDLGTVWAIRYEVEPSVRLAPGAEAELWGVATNPDCTAPADTPQWELQVNGVTRVVLLPDDGACGPEPVAFFPR